MRTHAAAVGGARRLLSALPVEGAGDVHLKDLGVLIPVQSPAPESHVETE